MNKKWLTVVLLTSVLGTTSACSNASEPAAGQQVAAEVKNVAVLAVKKEQQSRISELSGTLQPFEEATVSFEVGGRLTELKFNEGDNVKAGQVLARIDSADYNLQLAKANAGVNQAGASLEQVMNGAREQEIATAQATVSKAEIGYKQALDAFNRTAKLFQEKAVSQNDYELAENRLKLAEKDLQTAKEALSLTTQGARQEVKDQTRSSYNLAVISKDQAALTLEKTQLKAPINGTIIAKQTSVGQLINVGTPVYQIAKVDTLKVILPVPDRDISEWKVGNAVILNLYGDSREGKVTKIHPATNQSTGTIGVEVTVPNTKQDWYTGQVVKASRAIQGAVGIYVPIEAVISTGTEPYVFVMRDGKAIKTQVKLGELFDNKVEIVSGLNEGDQLIVKGMDRLFNEDLVQVAGGTNK
ncbi:efflux RND transporter periplasmic adaptor subunit [Brevibacillus dissolubilis]|uniref:efflux RND transporter periplasmic adaptor subunit n=1 Tax=Brevibacillus dissolubilis TaxID=1844116 RepID=UPI0011164EE5|nr:efflux RND transporter periplasmic adaptor subunit [Brevibacillus dissolubilis]